MQSQQGQATHSNAANLQSPQKSASSKSVQQRHSTFNDEWNILVLCLAGAVGVASCQQGVNDSLLVSHYQLLLLLGGLDEHGQLSRLQPVARHK